MENKKENRAFNEMYIAAKKRLEGKNPIEIAKNSGAEFDEEKSIRCCSGVSEVDL